MLCVTINKLFVFKFLSVVRSTIFKTFIKPTKTFKINEAKQQTLEKEKADALEMAEKAHEAREKKKKG